MKGNFCDMFVGMMMVTGQRLSFKGQDKTQSLWFPSCVSNLLQTVIDI